MDWIYHIQRHAALTSSECRAIIVISFIIFTGSAADLFISQQQVDPALRANFDAETQFNFAPISLADTIKSKSNKSDSLLVAGNKADSTLNLNESKTSPSLAGRMININDATKSQLITLKGIGPSLAKRIIDYRSKNGPFNDIADIKKVKGIGKGKFNAIKMRITTS